MIPAAEAAEANGAELAAGVATHSLDVLATLPPMVAIAFVIVGGAVLLATVTAATLIAYWRWGRPAAEPSAPDDPADRTDPGDGAVSAEVLSAILSTTGEFARQVGHLAEVVEALGATVGEVQAVITGCATCPFHPNAAAVKKGS